MQELFNNYMGTLSEITISELLTSRKLKSHHFIDKFQIGVGINGFGVV